MPFCTRVDSESNTRIFTNSVEVSNRNQLNAVDLASGVSLVIISKAFGDFDEGAEIYYNPDTQNWELVKL